MDAGTRYGRLVILSEAESKRGRRMNVRCDCGKEKIVFLYKLANGSTKSCGCLRHEGFLEALSAADHPRLKHGDAGTPLYTCWQNMKARCSNPNLKVYRWYGAKGVKVCDEWLSYPVFKEWALSHGYQDTLTIERIDPNGNYEPSNCEWITQSENARRSTQR